MGRDVQALLTGNENCVTAMPGEKKEDRWLVDVHIEQASASLENGFLRSACMPITTR